MPGKIKRLIDSIISEKTQGNPMLERVIKTKLILKGINPNKYNLESEDDPVIIAKLERMMSELRKA